MDKDERRLMRLRQMEQFLDSGMTVTEWTRLNHMASSTFYFWMNKFAEEDPEKFGRTSKPSNWIEVSRKDAKQKVSLAKVDCPASPPPSPLATPEISIPNANEMVTITANGITIAVPADNTRALASVIKMVMES